MNNSQSLLLKKDGSKCSQYEPVQKPDSVKFSVRTVSN